MFQAVIDANKIEVKNPDNEWITSGSVNTNFIKLTLSEDWTGLMKTVIFQTPHVMIPIILEEDKLEYEMAIPWECMVYVNDTINIGLMGTRPDNAETTEDEQKVLPTVWGHLPEKVRQGVIVGDPIEGTPTYDSYQALLKVIKDLLENGGGGGGNGTFDHDLLQNRELPNQHPIASITGLKEFEESMAPISDETIKALVDKMKGGGDQNGSTE